jgi:hypothetical protein
MQLFGGQKPNILLEVTPKLYPGSVSDFLADLLALGYRAYFLYERHLLKLEAHRTEVHNRAENYGVRVKYMTNVVLTMESLPVD